MKNVLPKLLASVSLLTVMAAEPVSAQLLTINAANPEEAGATSISPSAGYELFEAYAGAPGVATSAANVTMLPSYVASVSTTGEFNFNNTATPADAVLTVGTNAYVTGLDLAAVTAGTTTSLATITLTGTVPTSFILGIDTDNIYAPDGPTQLKLSSSGVTVGGVTTGNTTSLIEGSTTGTAGVNNIFYTLVTGAVAGETITIAGTNTTSVYPEIGAVTFDSVVSSPEPSTWALMFAGLGALVVLARRKQNLLS